MAGSVRIDESRSGAGFYGPAHGGYVSTFGYPSKVSISRIEAAIIRGAFNSPTERFTSSAIKAVMTPTVKAIRQLLWTHSDLQGSSAREVKSGDPSGNRTRATAVKGRCPNR